MAEQQTVTFSDKPISAAQKASDLVEHTKTYDGFIKGFKWTLATTSFVLIVLYFVFVY